MVLIIIHDAKFDYDNDYDYDYDKYNGNDMIIIMIMTRYDHIIDNLVIMTI